MLISEHMLFGQTLAYTKVSRGLEVAKAWANDERYLKRLERAMVDFTSTRANTSTYPITLNRHP
jgi:hypothetical protein